MSICRKWQQIGVRRPQVLQGQPPLPTLHQLTSHYMRPEPSWIYQSLCLMQRLLKLVPAAGHALCAGNCCLAPCV